MRDRRGPQIHAESRIRIHWRSVALRPAELHHVEGGEDGDGVGELVVDGVLQPWNGSKVAT